jgi:hypothetical protein
MEWLNHNWIEKRAGPLETSLERLDRLQEDSYLKQRARPQG